MKKSKMAVRLLLALGLLIGGTSLVQAAESTASADRIYGNITQGHAGVSASLSLSSTSIEASSAFTTFTFNARGQYFLADRIGLGPVLRFSTRSNFSTISVGPSAIYYFWTRDRLGVFLAQDITLLSQTTSGNTFSTVNTDSQLGLNYFLYPSVAIGPAIDFIHQFGTATFFSRINQIAFLGQFSIYL